MAALAERAVEPNGYYLPAWELAVNASARGRTGVSALSAWSEVSPAQGDERRLIGLLPVVSMWRDCKIPLPALVSASPYGTLCTPLLDRDIAGEAARRLMAQARARGAHALILRDVSLNGAAMKAIAEVLRQDGLHPRLLNSHLRACLDARREADELLRDALGGKKLKELRRQRNRLAEHGAVRFDVARTPEAVAVANRDIPGAGSERLERQARHRARAGRRRCRLYPARHQRTRRDRPMRNRDAARRRYAGRGRDRAPASGPRILFQARRRRALCEVFARRAADARPDAASVRRCGACHRRLHRGRRSSDDQSDLARAAQDRRRADSATPERSAWYR